MGLQIGRYETLREIASGGMATVHLGRAVGAGGFERLFAIKIMHRHVASDPEFIAMFLDEARLAAKIRHPNVVPTLDIVESEGQGAVLVMEYVEGPSLHQLIKTLRARKERIPLGIAIRLFLDVLAGLDAAHELCGDHGAPLNLVHRDVTPQNILLGVDGTTRITDFGVAHAESRLSSTRGSQVKGKLAFMAPEQIGAQSIDGRCDVYAAGVVLFEVLTDRRLFEADNDGALIAMIIKGPAMRPSNIDSSIPGSIEMACMQALVPNRDQRFPSAAAFADALEDAARVDGVKIASRKELGKFVRSAGAHQTATELMRATNAPPPLVAPASEQSASGVANRSGSVAASVITKPTRRRTPTWAFFAMGGAIFVGAGFGALYFSSQAPRGAAQPSNLDEAPSAFEPAKPDLPEPSTSLSASGDAPRSADVAEEEPVPESSASAAPSSPTTAAPPAPKAPKQGNPTDAKPSPTTFDTMDL